MDWVKLTTDYYRDLAVVTGTDAAEVMWTRGLALAGEIEQSGFLPDALLATLTRRPAQAKRIAGELVRAGLWDRVKGGYQIVNFARINEELERIVERKRRDRDRKRKERAASHESSDPASVDVSADSPAPRPKDRLSGESKSKRTTAAAREGDAGKTLDLPPAVEILRAALEARKLVVRWDRLTSEQHTEIEQLIETHGDAALVASAMRDFQTDKPAVFAQAWLPSWRHLRRPGDLAVVPDEPCTEPGHSGTTRHCVQCASERKAAR